MTASLSLEDHQRMNADFQYFLKNDFPPRLSTQSRCPVEHTEGIMTYPDLGQEHFLLELENEHDYYLWKDYHSQQEFSQLLL